MCCPIGQYGIRAPSKTISRDPMNLAVRMHGEPCLLGSLETVCMGGSFVGETAMPKTNSTTNTATTKKKKITFSVSEEEHAQIKEAARACCNSPSTYSRHLALEYAQVYAEDKYMMAWPPRFGVFGSDGDLLALDLHEGGLCIATKSERARRLGNSKSSAATKPPPTAPRNPRELCTTATPCKRCLADDGTHKHGGDCPEQADIIIDVEGHMLGGSLHSKNLGKKLYADFAGDELITARRFYEAAMDGSPIPAEYESDRVFWISPTFSRTERGKVVGYRCLWAPAFE